MKGDYMDWLFKVDNNICALRVAGILVRDGKIYLQKEKSGDEYAIPGGHVRIGETTEEALIREYREEIGADIKCKRLAWTEECFWEWNGRSAHTICFYYLIDLCRQEDIPDRNEFSPHRDNENVLSGWVRLDDIKDITVYPEFLKDEIFRLDECPKHFVSR